MKFFNFVNLSIFLRVGRDRRIVINYHTKYKKSSFHQVFNYRYLLKDRILIPQTVSVEYKNSKEIERVVRILFGRPTNIFKIDTQYKNFENIHLLLQLLQLTAFVLGGNLSPLRPSHSKYRWVKW